MSHAKLLYYVDADTNKALRMPQESQEGFFSDNIVTTMQYPLTRFTKDLRTYWLPLRNLLNPVILKFLQCILIVDGKDLRDDLSTETPRN